jgi:predicted ABC-type ATPase
VVGGPNGAGKSTLVARYLRGRLPVVNPDEIAARIAPGRVNEPTVQLEAGRIAVAERLALLNAGQGLLVETTLTGHSELRLIGEAAKRGYKVTLVFVGIDRPDVSGNRVALRVGRGGHDVPDDAIVRRFGRSLANLPVAAAASDRVFVLDNSGERPRLLLVTEAGRPVRRASTLPPWLLAAWPEIG